MLSIPRGSLITSLSLSNKIFTSFSESGVVLRFFRFRVSEKKKASAFLRRPREYLASVTIIIIHRNVCYTRGGVCDIIGVDL
jgi:hypothetical protein